jgi:outer membrane immunogenic protein
VRCVWLGLTIAGTIAGPGLAADLPVAVKAAPTTATTPFSWSGTYVGLNVGGAWGSFNFDPNTMNDLTGTAIDGGSTRLTNNGIIGGFQTGHNWQFGSWVLGIEHQVQFGNFKQTLTIVNPAGALQSGDFFTAETDVLNATRAKVGWAWDRLLLFTTAGLELGLLNGSASYVARPGGSPALTFSDDDKYRVGYTVGAGLDYALTDRVSVGVEYRYFDLGKETYNLGAVTGTATAGASTVSNNLKLNASEVTARLNMKLGNWFGGN